MDQNNISQITIYSVAKEVIKSKYKKSVNEWVPLVVSLGIEAALYPFAYARTLMQLGYEPIPAKPGKSLLGNSVMVLPNIFQYASYIKSVDGLRGCYIGFPQKAIGMIIAKTASRIVDNKMLPTPLESMPLNDEQMSNEEAVQIFKHKLKRQIILCITEAIMSYPFRLITVRMMSQFVGRDTTYSSLISAVVEIYKNEGLQGFFNGFMPRLLFELGCLILTSATIFFGNRYLFKKNLKSKYNSLIAQYIFANLLYPLHVTSTCMCINGSGLFLGKPPMTPIFKNWLYCFDYLARKDQLMRGNSLFLRQKPKLILPRMQRSMPLPRRAPNPESAMK